MDRHGSPSLGPKHDDSSRVTKGGESAADRLAALKARVAAAIGNSSNKGGSGLGVALHPALADVASTTKPSAKPSASTSSSSRHSYHPKSASRSHHPASQKQKQLDLSAPTADEVKSNPYYDANLQGPQQRQARALQFHQRGHFIQQGQALRRQAQLEALKAKIAATSKRVGIDEDRDIEKAFLIEDVPDIEWWDQGLVENDDYDTPVYTRPDSVVTAYVQHPVAIEAADESRAVAVKPMYLTTKEQRKLRRQRRAAEMNELRAKQRLGLLPTPEPKVRLKNMMRVLGQQATADPSATEAKVRRDIAERHDQHLETNEERKLDNEQKAEKLARNQENDLARGVHLLVYKINNLSNGQHRFKIQKNAEQLAITGLVLLTPRFCLVIAEAGEWAIKKYKKLLENRIDWTENTPDRQRDSSHEVKDWLRAENEKGELKDLSTNRCTLLFEGEERQSAFKRWSSKIVETDQEAREVLAKVKMDNFWNLAKSVV